MVDDYELLPHEELEHLRREIASLKKNPYPGTKQNQNLLDSMDELNSSIKKLIHIFEGTQEELIKEYSEASPTKLLKEISEQNAKIAQGIIALAEMVKNTQAPQVRSQASQAPRQQPQFNPNQGFNPMSQPQYRK
jgi:hypothetical protein